MCSLLKKKLRCGPVDNLGLRSEPVHTVRAELGCEPAHTVMCSLLRKKMRCGPVDTVGLRSEPVHTMRAELGCEPVYTLMEELECEPVHTVMCSLLRKKMRRGPVDNVGLRSEPVHTMWSVRKTLKCEPVDTMTPVMNSKLRVQLAINCCSN